MSEAKPAGLLKSFPRVFWVANVMELFERGAYYGMNSVLAVYLTADVAKGGLGFGESSVGFLQSLIYACTYVVPILGGALADRYGYRRMLLLCFALLSTGYFAAGYMSSYAAVFASLLVMAMGGGLFKPIISGTIARSTNESNSGFGFGIYYWMINLGAFLAPLVVSILKGFSWRYVFLASSAYVALMFLPTISVFRDPPLPENRKTLGEVARGAAMVLGDARFKLAAELTADSDPRTARRTGPTAVICHCGCSTRSPAACARWPACGQKCFDATRRGHRQAAVQPRINTDAHGSGGMNTH